MSSQRVNFTVFVNRRWVSGSLILGSRDGNRGSWLVREGFGRLELRVLASRAPVRTNKRKRVF